MPSQPGLLPDAWLCGSIDAALRGSAGQRVTAKNLEPADASFGVDYF